MSSKDSNSKIGASTFNNAARKTSLFGNMKRKASTKQGHDYTRSGKNQKALDSSFDSDFNSEDKPNNTGAIGSGGSHHHNTRHDPIRRTSS